MTKFELLEALAPFDDETFIDIELQGNSGYLFCLPITSVKYVPMTEHTYAELRLTTYPPTTPKDPV